MNENENEVLTGESDNLLNNSEDYINTIKEMKRTMVPRSELEQALSEKKQLIKALADGEVPDGLKPDAVLSKRKASEITANIIRNGGQMSWLEGFEEVMALRDAVKEEGGTDFFLHKNANGRIDRQCRADAERRESIYRECLEYANGDAAVFANELARHIEDDNIL